MSNIVSSFDHASPISFCVSASIDLMRSCVSSDQTIARSSLHVQQVIDRLSSWGAFSRCRSTSSYTTTKNRARMCVCCRRHLFISITGRKLCIIYEQPEYASVRSDVGAQHLREWQSAFAPCSSALHADLAASCAASMRSDGALLGSAAFSSLSLAFFS